MSSGRILASVFSMWPATAPTPPPTIDSIESSTESTNSLIWLPFSTKNITTS